MKATGQVRNVPPLALLAALASLLLCLNGASAVAAPLDELTGAVLRGGAPSLGNASPRQFLRAYMSILARVKPNEVIWYLNAAVKARPDLAPKVVIATLNVRRPKTNAADRRTVCQLVGDVVQAAIMASPEQAVAIVKAAFETAPFARDCILAAATAAAPDLRIAFVEAATEAQSAALDGIAMNGSAVVPTIGTINPANYTAPVHVNSPEQPPSVP